MTSLLKKITAIIGGTPKFGNEPREELKVKFEVKQGIAEVVTLNDQPLRQSTDGKEWTGLVGAGVYVLRWIADSGLEDEPYTIEITAPEKDKWKPKKAMRTASDGHVDSYVTRQFGASGAKASTPADSGTIIGFVALCLFFGTFSSAAAQSVDSAYARVDPVTRVAPPGTTLTPIADLAAIYLTAGATDKKVSVEAQVQSWMRGTDGIASRRLKLSGAAPLDEEASTTTLGDLRGPQAGTEVSATLSGFRRDEAGETASLLAWCQRSRTANQLPADFACGAQGEEPFDYAELSSLAASGKVRPEVFRTYRQLAGARLRNLWSLTGTIGRTKFNYFEENTFAHQSTDETPWSVEGTYGQLWRLLGGVNLVAAGLRYERSYKAGSKSNICVPLGSGGATQCRNQPVGAPAAGEAWVANVQARRFLSPRLAVNPKVSFRIDDEVIGLQMPIYFAGPADGGLIAGLLPSWNSEDDRFSLSLFVGKAFRFGI